MGKTDDNSMSAHQDRAAPILNQAWEDVADDVVGSIEKAIQPLLQKAVDDIYCGLLDETQNYLKDNLAFNIASRISTAEREASTARQEAVTLREQRDELLEALGKVVGIESNGGHGSHPFVRVYFDKPGDEQAFHELIVGLSPLGAS